MAVEAIAETEKIWNSQRGENCNELKLRKIMRKTQLFSKGQT